MTTIDRESATEQKTKAEWIKPELKTLSTDDTQGKVTSTTETGLTGAS